MKELLRRYSKWAALAVLLILGAVWLRPHVEAWLDRGEDVQEQRDEVADSLRSRVGALEDTVDAVRAREQALQDTLEERGEELERLQRRLHGAIGAGLDTLEAQVPDSLRHIVTRLRFQVDSMQAAHVEARATWQGRFESQQREIVALEQLADSALAVADSMRQGRDFWRSKANPSLLERAVGSAPEGAAKVGVVTLACLRSSEACLTALLMAGVDAAF